jgi:hypothetical protein
MNKLNLFMMMTALLTGLIFLTGGAVNPVAAAPPTEKNCTDGKDNDRDGDTDGADSDCQPEPPPDDGNESGTDLKLDCLFANEDDDTVLGEPDEPYIDGVGGVGCSTGGTTQPNLSGIVLDTIDKGKRQRLLELAFISCANFEGEDNCYDVAKNPADLPEHLFEINSPENVTMSVRPYRDPNAPDGLGHIQNLAASDTPYKMAVRFALKGGGRGVPRIVIGMASRHIQGDKFEGILCDLGDQTMKAATEDVNVYIGEGPQNRFIVTTSGPGSIQGGFMRAAICSNIPPEGVDSCGGAGDSDVCNFHGFVYAKFTLAADVIIP